MIIPVNILCKHSRVNNPWRTILPTKTHMDARHPRTELKTMSSFTFFSLTDNSASLGQQVTVMPHLRTVLIGMVDSTQLQMIPINQ